MTIDQRIATLRAEMKIQGADAYIIPTSDPHQSEYPATHWQSREWISGFTGSAGIVIITQDHAGLWSDSRYFLQAEEELEDSEMELHKMYNQFGAPYIKWLSKNLPTGATVAIDGPLFSLGEQKNFNRQLSAKGINLKITYDLIDKAWSDRPALPEDAVFEHELKFAGKSRGKKLNAIRKEMQEYDADYHLVTTLDDIAWIFNLRGSDVTFNPVFVAYAVITRDGAMLFIDDQKVPEQIQKNLEKDNIDIQPYTAISGYLSALPEGKKILIHEATINYYLHQKIKGADIVSGKLISRHLKAEKNETELKHFENAMVKDGVALCHAFVWLEKTLEERTVGEKEFSDRLAYFRSQQDHYYGESFAAIIGYKGNGAIIHYRPEEDTCAQIRKEGILLCDSGGQYQDGTTDITRTIALSEPTAEQKDRYTRVLKGHIALAQAQFPKGTNGGQLDILARKALWDQGLNYLHGTGHGVGFFLNVHEPPQGFAPGTSGRAVTPHQPGMVTSNEPGFYKEGEYGIRIENLVITKKANTDGFYDFKTITYFPIDTSLIDMSMMTEEETGWLNRYHRKVKEMLSPHLDEEHRNWMDKKCASI